jgi:3,4-dihydroxy 2-butanone 4-phosphate synthase/GTP cyclohydrolase II
MARRPDLEAFAELHQLKIGTIADLISYRLANEMTVERLSSCHMPTEFGDFTLYSFQDTVNGQVHMALAMGNIEPDQETVVRVHMADPLNDLLNSKREVSHFPIPDVMKRIQELGKGVLVILRQPQQNKQLASKIEAYQQQDRNELNANSKTGWDFRTFGVGAQILANLGVKKMRVIGTPTKLTGLSGFGLDLVGYDETE